MRRISLTEIWRKIAKVRVRRSFSADFLQSEKTADTARVSLSDILRTRTKTKVIGLFLVLLIATLSFQLIIGKNPWRAKAATITITTAGNYTIVNNVLTCPGGNTVAPCVGGSPLTIPTTDQLNVSGTNINVVVSGTTNIDTISVNGTMNTVTMSGNTISGNFSVNGTMNAATMSGTTISGDLYVPGTMNTVTLSGTTNIGGSMTVSGGSPSNTAIMSGTLKVGHSLSVTNGATITHPALVSVDINDDGHTLTDSGLLKKVDIETKGDIALTSGGKIDVSGKGYPGTAWMKGYGPSRGEGNGMTVFNNDASAGGGNFGSGGKSYGNTTGNPYATGGIGILETTVNSSNFVPGSGGGDVIYHSGSSIITQADGGAGGGSVHLKAGGVINISSSSSILANGANGIPVALNGGINHFATGGGGGGTVWLEAQSYVFGTGGASVLAHANQSTTPTPSGSGAYNSSQVATIGAVTVPQGLNVTNISADGGNGYFFSNSLIGGPGGGGKIYIGTVSPPSPVSVQKVLTPIDRGNTAGCSHTTPYTNCNPNFNPYSLQKDDIIRVTINISGENTSSFDLQDELLKTSDQFPNYTCKPDTTPEYSPSAPTTVADPLVWTGLPSGTTAVSYNCKVQ